MGVGPEPSGDPFAEDKEQLARVSPELSRGISSIVLSACGGTATRPSAATGFYCGAAIRMYVPEQMFTNGSPLMSGQRNACSPRDPMWHLGEAPLEIRNRNPFADRGLDENSGAPGSDARLTISSSLSRRL
jgi:hypothetical protein